MYLCTQESLVYFQNLVVRVGIFGTAQKNALPIRYFTPTIAEDENFWTVPDIFCSRLVLDIDYRRKKNVFKERKKLLWTQL